MLEILNIILKWKNQILIFTSVAMLASILITMPIIMPPYYKSKEILYLSNPISTDRAALFNEKEVGGVSIFGGKEDVNRFLSILNSDKVSLATINKFHLVRHYKLEGKDNVLALYYTKKEFYSNFNAIRNDLGAIEVSMLDTDAPMASDMVKYIIATSDSIYRSMLMENKAIVLKLIDQQIAAKAHSLPQNNDNADELLKLNTLRDQYAVSSSADFKTIYIVEDAAPAEKKTKPVRWLIVLSTAFVAVLFASFVALLIELYKNADKYGFKNS
ncbi:MAG TPA: Wzz/FepE/Etk N-terminal domain-containing protein [Chitinophagales bacterium]|nr:Wzz/FepE/Etk N-terminal domain-containing protein [Chitinophagales bacterium]